MSTFIEDSSYNVKEEVRTRIDIVHVIGKYVKLKNAGHNSKGLCPFHKEKTPSFTVNPEKGVFHCFGCGKGGDVFTFIMEIEGLSFPEALQRLAEEAGVTIPEYRQSVQTTDNKTTISKTDSLRIHELVTRFYYNEMKKSPEAIAYFKSRNLKSEIVKEFRLGYSPEGWSNLIDYAKSNKIHESKLVDCGLAITSSQDSAPYDRFRNRIIFPIFDISGKPIAFAGRGMDKDAKPKYLNSPETNLYRKNRVLYGLHHARSSIKEKKFVIFVEGYMDFLSLYQEGIHNVVATSGTALTEEHGHLIRRFTSKIVLVFDGDNAGSDAAERAIFNLASLQIDVRVFMLPKDEDPDSYIKNVGPAKFQDKVEKANTALDFLLLRAMKSHDSNTAPGKSGIIDYIMPIIESTSDPIVQSGLIKQVAEQLDLKEQLIYRKISKKGQTDIFYQNKETINKAEQFLQTEEGSFFHLIVSEPSLIGIAQKIITAEIFSDFYSNNLFSIIVDTYNKNKSLDNIIDRSDDPEIIKVLSLMLTKKVVTENSKDDVKHKTKRCLGKLFKKRKHIITKQLKTEQDPEIKKKLLLSQKELIKSQQELITQLGALTTEW